MSGISAGLLHVAVLIHLCCTSSGSLRLSRQSAGRGREYVAPEISMRYVSPHWLNIQCTIHKSSPEFKLFVICPALSSPCYENCLPLQPCSEESLPETKCLPDKTSVNCTESVNLDGSKVTNLWIDKRSVQLHGSWFCTRLGMKSSVVKVVPEEVGPQVIHRVLEPPELSPPLRNTAVVQSEDLADAIERVEEDGKPPFYAVTAFLSQSPWIFCLIAIFIISVTVNIILWCRWCFVCLFTARRRKYHEDQKTLGDMICLPTQRSRTQSGLWENDVYPAPFVDCLQEPYYLKRNSSKFQRFGTFGPNNFTFDPPPLQNRAELSDEPFPQYFKTLQPNHLWRTRSVVATFSPGEHHVAGERRIPFRIDTAPSNQAISQSDILPPPVPLPPLSTSLSQGINVQKGLPRNSMNTIPGMTTVYDDVASSSSITVVSRDVKKNNVQLGPQLPSLVEVDKALEPYNMHQDEK